MSDFLKTLLCINGYVACALVMFCLLVAPPVRADDGGVVAAVSGAIATAMDVGGNDDD
jgi:hypothetical protein